MLILYLAFAALLAGLSVFALVRAFARTPLSRRATAISVAVWIVALGVMTLRPAGGRVRINLVPAIVTGNISPFDILANMAVFVPLGLLLAVAGCTLLRALGTALAVSLLVEVTQYVLDVGRTADLNDLVTNVAGAAVGWGIAWAIRRAAHPAGRTETARPTAHS